MPGLTLSIAQSIIANALSLAQELQPKPRAIVALDERGAVRASAAEDDTSLMPLEVAHGKSYGTLALGLGSLSIGKRAKEQPYFVAAVSHVTGGALVPVPGGVLLKNHDGILLGSWAHRAIRRMATSARCSAE